MTHLRPVRCDGHRRQWANCRARLSQRPPVEVQVGTNKLKAKARTVTGEEGTKLWPVALKFWPPYADYTKKTEREIPVVVLDPVG
jgi:deazaflavin-dependent oxidoreductase (nitroreductase family)